jgi:hypothetical protein
MGWDGWWELGRNGRLRRSSVVGVGVTIGRRSQAGRANEGGWFFRRGGWWWWWTEEEDEAEEAEEAEGAEEEEEKRDCSTNGPVM